MVRRVSSSHLRSKIRQIESRQRQAVRDLNSAINRYNREVRAHNSRVRANRQRLESELRKLSRPTSTTVRVTYRTSVRTFHQSFLRLEAAADRPESIVSDYLLDLSEVETANSLAALNALTAPASVDEADDPSLRESTLGHELEQIDPDLDSRWRGALFALSSRNPDAARHFCTSAREILTSIIDGAATDADVLQSDPNAERTPEGSVSRRARIAHCLERRGSYSGEFVDFVEADIDDVIALFAEFNSGTHGVAGRFTLDQLRTLKARVEHAIGFLHRIAVG